MTSRDEHLEKFKANLDEWNAQIEKLEQNARKVQADMQSQYDKQLESLRAMRDEAQKKYIDMQNATADAWDVMLKGTEKAWQTWFSAFEDARSKFRSKD